MLTNGPPKIIRLKAVESKTGLKRSTIYLKMSEDDFPKPVKLTKRCVGWIEGEIDNWIDSRIKQSRNLDEVCYANA